MATSNGTTCIREYRKGDGREVCGAYLRGVVLQDNTFNYNGQSLFIGSGGKQGCDASDLFVEDAKTCRMVYRDGSPTCSECGRELDYDSRFCDQCGAKVVSNGADRRDS